MHYQDERELLVEYGKKMLLSGLTKGSGGNLSIYIRQDQVMLITPSGLDYTVTRPEDIVAMDPTGRVISGTRKPSSEHAMHNVFYQRREDIDAVVHTHSVYAATIASLRWDLPAAYYLIGVSGGKNVRCARYATYGTTELAENAFTAMKDRYAVLLANHGMLTGARNLAGAFSKAEELELCAEVYYRAKTIGEPVILEDEEIETMLDRFKSYGQTITK